MSRPLVVKLTAGADAPERAVQGLTVAATAVASGLAVSLWLTGESAWFATAGGTDAVTLEHSAPPAELMAAVIAGGKVTLCTQCAARRGLTEEQLLEGITIAGAATFVSEVTAPDAQALIY